MARSPLASRRRFLQGAAAGLAALTGCRPDRPLGLDDSGSTLLTPTGSPNPSCPDPFAGGTFLEVIPWDDPPRNPFGQLYSEGWDARRRYDLRLLVDGELDTPTELFYVRTEYPDLLTTDPDAWTVRIEGLVDVPADVPIDAIRTRAVDQGRILLECSGNGGDFGLMSTASWAGAPLLELIDAFASRAPEATALLVRGFDEHSVPSEGGHSTPGASWVFPLDALGDAFLATSLGGQPLPPDNGAPVRLLVPGWYGCCNIKWVTHLELVDDSAPATSQMEEFAFRTHQDGVPALARDFRPARQELSAVPIQVERWLLDGAVAYRVVGILWGGERLVSGLRFHDGRNDRPVDCFEHLDVRTWNLWSHRWLPANPGSFVLSNSVDEEEPQIRLDLGWYAREITLDEPAG